MTNRVANWTIDISEEMARAQRQRIGPKTFGVSVCAKLTAADVPRNEKLTEIRHKLASATTYTDTDKALKKLYDWGDENGLRIIAEKDTRRHR